METDRRSPSRLIGSVAVVTGASRGIGKGIAIELGRAGATVYVTGRSTRDPDSRWPGTIAETAAAVTGAGGLGISAPCDHRIDEDVIALFRRINSEHGRLDLLVNNAAAFGATKDGYPQEIPYWELAPSIWDEMMAVGLRSHFVVSRCAAPLLIAQRRGLIVNISSAGASAYAFNAGYGAVKAGVDKLTADMAADLKPHGVTCVSLWPPFTRTEKYLAEGDAIDLSHARSPNFTGRAVVALATDPAIFDKTGRALCAIDLAGEYHFGDG